ncbi:MULTISPECIES: hypothetical protein [Chroococcidiopsis]|nr:MULTISPECIES: hypothetical protein [Chroococcidiopsis]
MTRNSYQTRTTPERTTHHFFANNQQLATDDSSHVLSFKLI